MQIEVPLTVFNYNLIWGIETNTAHNDLTYNKIVTGFQGSSTHTSTFTILKDHNLVVV